LCVPEAREVKRGVWRVPDTAEVRDRLRRIAMPFNEPSNVDDYDWPGPYTPMAHQVETTKFLLSHRRALVANDMGTGKTLAALWAIDCLMRRGEVTRALVVCPKSTMQMVWADEVLRTLAPRGVTAAVLSAPAKRRWAGLAGSDPICIVNPEGLPDLYDRMRGTFDVVVLDEAALFRNSRSQRYRQLSRWLAHSKNRGVRLWLMTGTPTPNAPTDAWALAKLLESPVAPRSFTAARGVLMYQAYPGSFKWLPRQGAADIVARMLRPSIRYVRDDCIDLPPTTTQFREVSLSVEQGHVYEKMVKQYVVGVAEGEIVAVNEAVKGSRLLQIAAGAGYLADGQRVPIDASPRIERVLEALEQGGGKGLVFSPYRGVLPMLEEALSRWYRVGVVHGGVSQSKRYDIFHRFQDPQEDEEIDVLLAQPMAMSHGVSLPAARVVVWYSPLWSTEAYTQANARVERRGKTHPVTIVHLVATDFEKAVYERLGGRQAMQGVLLDYLRGAG